MSEIDYLGIYLLGIQSFSSVNGVLKLFKPKFVWLPVFTDLPMAKKGSVPTYPFFVVFTFLFVVVNISPFSQIEFFSLFFSN